MDFSFRFFFAIDWFGACLKVIFGLTQRRGIKKKLSLCTLNFVEGKVPLDNTVKLKGASVSRQKTSRKKLIGQHQQRTTTVGLSSNHRSSDDAVTFCSESFEKL